MPVPFILGAVAAGSALYGAYKGVSGAIDHNKASDINSDAHNLVNTARKLLEVQRQSANDVLTDYGSRKLRAFNGVIADFVQTFSRLKNVELLVTAELDVASRTIIRTLVKQMRVRLVPFFHGLHRRLALQG